MLHRITENSVCFVAGRPCGFSENEQLVAAFMAIALFGWTLMDLRSKVMWDPGLDLSRRLRQVVFAMPVPAILWYDSLHPSATLKILAAAAALAAIWDWATQWRRSRVAGAGLPRRKRISQSKGSEAFSVVVDERKGGGYTAWSTDDDDLKVEGSTLLAVDEQVRRYVHGHLLDGQTQDVSLAYVWEDSQPSVPAAAAGPPPDKLGRPPRSVYFDVRESPADGYLAEGEPGFRIVAPTLDGLAPAARTAIGARWPSARSKDMPWVIFGWVRTVQV